jgi:hypothetical protein
MERLSQIGTINDLFGWLEAFTAELVAGAYRDGRERPAVWDKIAALVDEYEAGRTSYDSLYCYLAAAHALHAAGDAVGATGDKQWAGELHSMGQMFIKYGVSDIEKMLAALAYQIAAQTAASNDQTLH